MEKGSRCLTASKRPSPRLPTVDAGMLMTVRLLALITWLSRVQSGAEPSLAILACDNCYISVYILTLL